MKKPLSVFMLAMMNLGAICNIANLPYTAQHGFSSLFYYALALLVFFLPVALISAELATGWSEKGGVYVWVKEALGIKAGFVAIWLQWVENVIWYPTILGYMATTLGYLIDPRLAENNLFVFFTVLTIVWLVTFLNFFGMNISSWLITLCVAIGIFIPAALIILFGILWICSGHPLEITYSFSHFLPPLKAFSSYSIFAGMLLIFSGLEVSAVHAQEVKNPRKDYPKAILLSTILIFLILSAAALAIATVVPKAHIQLATGTIEMMRYFLADFHLSYLLPAIALLMFVGAFGMVSTWIIGPSKGLLATALDGELPPSLQKTNRKGVHVGILVFQALIISALASIYIFLPSISATYQL
ncbi:MAG: APC family permease, partial [Parachlamydiales bacterium]